MGVGGAVGYANTWGLFHKLLSNHLNNERSNLHWEVQSSRHLRVRGCSVNASIYSDFCCPQQKKKKVSANAAPFDSLAEILIAASRNNTLVLAARFEND